MTMSFLSLRKEATKEEIVKYATFLFGPNWQTPLAHALSMERSALVRALASNSDLPVDLLKRLDRLHARYGEQRPTITPDEVIDFATKLYGLKWQEPLAAAVGFERASLVRLLASGGRLPMKLSTSVLSLMEQWGERQQAELDKFSDYVRRLKRAQASQTVASGPDVAAPLL